MGTRRYLLAVLLVVPALACAGPARPEFRQSTDPELAQAEAHRRQQASRRSTSTRAQAEQTADALSRLELLTEGAQALSAGDAVLAEDLLSAFLEFEPDNGMALFLYGVSLLDLGRRDEARDALIASTMAEPDDASGYAVLARIEFEMGDVEAAIAALQRATTCAPEESQHWTSLGLLYFDQDRWNEAYDALLHAVELDPADVAAHRALGRLYLSVGEYSLAERAFRTALALEPGDVGLRVALGHVLRDLDQAEEALMLYREASELEPDNPWLHANLASTLMELRRPHAARPHFESALSGLEGGGIDSAMVFLNYGSMLEGLGDLDGAELAYESSVEASPELAPAHEALGLLELNLGNRAAAQRHLMAADEYGTLHPDTLIELALLLEADDDWNAALTCSRRVLNGPDTDSGADLRRARLLLRSRHPDVHDAAAAVDLLLPLVSGAFANHPGSWELLSDAFASQGEVEEAIDALDGALRVARSGSPVVTRFEQRRARLLSQLESEP